jgi:hypothetical protein
MGKIAIVKLALVNGWQPKNCSGEADKYIKAPALRFTMLFDELASYPARRDKPDCITRLSVYKAEWPDLKALCAKYGPVQIVAVEQVPVIPVLEIDVLCQDAQTARALDDAWWAYTETSPHRPRSMEEALIWGEQFNPFPNIPRDWTC